MRWCGFIVVATFLAAPLTFAASTNTASISSHHRHFIVTAMPRPVAMDVAMWAESVFEKITRWTGRPVPYADAFPLVIAAENPGDESRSLVLKAQDFSDDRYLRQEMTLVHASKLDQEDALEVLTGLLVNRWLVARTGRAEDYVPDWLAVGIAQNLYPELHDRNLELLRKDEAMGTTPSVVELFSQRVMPPGRWPEKARAGLVMAWLAEVAGADRAMTRMLDVLASSGRVGAEDVLDLVGAASVREFEMTWQVWLAGQDRRLVPGRLSRDAADIERIIAMRPERFGLVYPGVVTNGGLDAGILINARRTDWAGESGRVLARQLGEALIGKAPELVEVSLRYIAFYDALSGKASAFRLRRLWARAENALDGYRRAELARQQFMDAVQSPTSQAKEPDRAAVKAWLDARE